MEEVSLDPNSPASVGPFSIAEAEADEASEDWKIAYHKLMHESVRTADVLFAAQAWKALDDNIEVQLSEANYGGSYGFYSLKAHALLEGVRGERLMHIIQDHESKTRLAWDSEHVTYVKVIEHVVVKQETIRVVQSQVNSGFPKVWPRSLLGIDWYGYDRKSRVYKYVFRTTQHRSVSTAKQQQTVAVIGTIGVIVRLVDRSSSSPRCELIIVVNINPGDSFPAFLANTCKFWLRDRVLLYARVARDWNKYYGSEKKNKNQP